jgi:hypothetical protein
MDKSIFDFIKSEEINWKTTRVPITSAKDWNMSEHIERCTAVANGWFYQGANDGLRPYNDIVTPIIDVAFRTEGFDVKDIVPYVDSAKDFYKSFIIKKYHPQWAREHELDTFIDEVVESSIVYDLVLVKNANDVRPEVVPLQEIAFCDQTDVLSGPICLKHQYSIPDLLAFKGKWNEDKIDEVIVMSRASKEVSSANDKEAKTPGRYIEVYELHGMFPEDKLKDDGDPDTYVDQLHIVTYYTDMNGNKNGITLYKGRDKKLTDVFKALKIDKVRSFGRACGRSIVERLFEPQVWTNYSGIRIKEMLDAAALVLAQTASTEIQNQKLTGVKGMTVLKMEDGKPLNRVDTNTSANLSEFANHQDRLSASARTLGSASDPAMGKAPASGTPFALQDLIVQQGEGIHDYRRGKIATFFADVLYRDWILGYLIKDINSSMEFSEELSLDEINEIADIIANNKAEKKIEETIWKTGKPVLKEEKEVMVQAFKEEEKKKGGRRFFKTLKDELKDVPIKVKVNVAGKQRYMAQNADKISKLIGNILANPQAFAMIPGLGSAYNQLLEESGMNPIDFSNIIAGVQMNPEVETKRIESPVEGEVLKEEVKK